MASARAGISKVLALFGNEFPIVFSGRKSELQHAVGIPISQLAVGKREAEQVMAAAAGANNDFANSVPSIGVAVGILRSKALVRMLVAGKNKVGMRCVQVLPEGLQLRMHSVFLENSAAKKCMMAISDNAGVGVFCEIALQPGFLR